MSQLLARWTIGNVKPRGYDCLIRSIESFLKLYSAEVVICHNCDVDRLPSEVLSYRLIDQRKLIGTSNPQGVAWKLYPSRLAPDQHEIVIDNDIIFEQSISEIDLFLKDDATLLLGETSRTYGRFEKHVPPGHMINSGIYGMPPHFNLQKFIDFYGDEWQANALGEHKENFTFDEQGLVAMALLSHPRHFIIPATSVTNCELHLKDGFGYHFVGLNRRDFHIPYNLYRSRFVRLHL